MSARTRMIIAIAGSVAVLLLFYFLFIGPRRGELGEVRTQVAAEQAQTTSLQAELDRLLALQDRAPELRAELARIEELVPDQHQTANFLFQVQEAADDAGVAFLEINNEQPKTPPEGAALAEVRFQIAAEGGYFAIQDFMRRLYDLDRALRIDSLGMTGLPDPQTGEAVITLDATARIFFQIPEGVTPGAAPGAPAAPASPAPAASPTDGVTPSPSV